jgi:hypothetical protein
MLNKTHSECVLSVLYMGGKTSRTPPLLPCGLTCSKREASYAATCLESYPSEARTEDARADTPAESPCVGTD